jgi:hypothetical protein
MKYALVAGDAPEEISGPSITSDDVQFSYATMLRWNDAERAACGIYQIVDDAIPEGKVATGSTLEQGDGVVLRHWTLEDAPPPPVPLIISDRQFFQGLALNSTITQEEALVAVMTGTIPASLEAFVTQLPEADQFSARMLLSGAIEFHRDHPLVPAVGAAFSWTDAQIDDFWRFCEAL